MDEILRHYLRMMRMQLPLFEVRKPVLCPVELHAYNTPDDHAGSWSNTLAEIRGLPEKES